MREDLMSGVNSNGDDTGSNERREALIYLNEMLNGPKMEGGKSVWVASVGKTIQPAAMSNGADISVCLIDLGSFQMLCLAHDRQSFEELDRPDGALDARPRRWYRVAKEDVWPFVTPLEFKRIQGDSDRP